MSCRAGSLGKRESPGETLEISSTSYQYELRPVLLFCIHQILVSRIGLCGKIASSASVYTALDEVGSRVSNDMSERDIETLLALA